MVSKKEIIRQIALPNVELEIFELWYNSYDDIEMIEKCMEEYYIEKTSETKKS